VVAVRRRQPPQRPGDDHQQTQRGSGLQHPMQLAQQSSLVLDRAQHAEAPADIDRVGPQRKTSAVGGDHRQSEEPSRGPAGRKHRLHQDRSHPESLRSPGRRTTHPGADIEQGLPWREFTRLGQPGQRRRTRTAPAGGRYGVTRSELLDRVGGPAGKVRELRGHRSCRHGNPLPVPLFQV
jgi:hypothetical protein